jgi:hypothetical protein
MRDFVDVGLVDIGSLELFFEVVDAQRHDRKTVDGRAGCFGIEFGLGQWLDVLAT